MTRICSNIVQIKLLDDVFQKVKFRISFHSAMNKLVEAISTLRKQLLKFYNVVSIGQLYFKMLTLFTLHVIGINEWRALHEGICCH